MYDFPTDAAEHTTNSLIVAFELIMACLSHTHSFQLYQPRSKCMLGPIDLPSSSLQQVPSILSRHVCKPETTRK